MRPRALLPYGLIAIVGIVVDQAFKAWVVRSMELGERIDLIPYFALYHTRNTGIAFSMFSEMSVTGLIVLTSAVALFVVWLASRTTPDQWISRIGFALIVGGAIGNLIDRTMLGYVIDYFLFHTPGWSFAIFNLADAFISVGAGLVVLDEVLTWRRERREKRAGG